MLKIAVIGTGTWGKNHVRVLTESGSADLVKICDAKGTNLEYLHNTFKIPTTQDHTEILQDSSIDAVSICVPSSQHYSIIKEALLSGKHVLVEKPMTTDSEQAIELQNLAGQKNLVLMVGHIFRYHPGVHKLKEEIKKGTFGKIRFMYGSRMGLMTPRQDCGVIYDFAVHDIDTFCYLLNELPTEVTCTGSFYNKNQFEDVGFITLSFSKNIKANVGVSWLTPKKVRELWIIGEEKSASMDYMTQELTIYNKGIVPQYDSFGEFSLVKQEGDDYSPFIHNKEPLKEEIHHFLECVEKSKKPISDAQNAIDVIKIVEACHTSLKEKKTIQVDFS